jgi:hypothetical protein
LLIQHVTGANGQRRMPPETEGEGLKAREIALIRKWVDQGAISPAGEKPEADPKEHWAFQAPVRPKLPKVTNVAWTRNPIDVLIASEQEKRGLIPQPPADKQILLRRVYLDLIGLPPTSAEQAAFVADTSPGVYEKVVDRLLSSPQYGERWGRHWMDIWRYSDWWGLGAEVRNSQKHIWHWRDWIVESLNQDKGYDQMLREMLAADELYPDDLDKLRATGYLARSYFKFNRNSWLDETIEHTGKAFLGLTMNCARCHDHKFDPISQRDYYRMRAFFEPYQIRTDELPGEADLEKDGLSRVFDCHPEAPTHLFIRGDERNPAKDITIPPAVPAVLSLGDLTIIPVTLPAEAYSPGLRPFVLDNHLRAAKRQIAVTREALQQVKAKLAQSEMDNLQSAAASATAQSQTNSLEQARAAVTVASKAQASAEAQALAIQAQAAADLARQAQPAAMMTSELARQAARAEKQAALAKAEEDLARTGLEMMSADPKKKAEMDKKLAANRNALAKARQALESPGETYTPLRGSLKTLESNTEDEASRHQPFPVTSTGRRSALARWITDPRHPLPARVVVNHLWARHFGKPLVATVFDFGRKGASPSHQDLLDFLAIELQENHWSLKHLHRLMVTSNTYRITSSSAGAPTRNTMTDGENRYCWRMNSARMQAEVIRDSLLHLAGDLELTMGGPSIDPNKGESSRRRSLYFVHSHNEHHKFLSIFDDASVLECYRRAESIVPQQALALENSALVLGAAEKIANRLSEETGDASEGQFVHAAFAAVLGCRPTAAEQWECEQALARLESALKSQRQTEPTRRARSALVRALLNHNDFITIR